VAEDDDERDVQHPDAELQRAEDAGVDDVAGRADDEEVAQPHVEDDLGGDPGVGAAEEDGQRPLPVGRDCAGGRRPGWGGSAAPRPNRALPAASSDQGLRRGGGPPYEGRPPRAAPRAAVTGPTCGDAHGQRLERLGEEVVALVVDHDEGREVLDLDLPDRLHAELGYSSTSTLLMQSWASRAAGPPIEPR
jgi:hypothetical protein